MDISERELLLYPVKGPAVILLMLAGAFSVWADIPGDVNQDGPVNAQDVQFVINAALGIATGMDCDIDCDGDVDAVDVQLVINAALGMNIGVPVPNLVGFDLPDVEPALTAAGLALGAVSFEYHNTVPAGTVISQNPAAGSMASPGSEVTLVISSGSEPQGQPVITAFAISNGAAATSSSQVTLNNTCTGIPTQYMASESPGFAGANWQAYSTSPVYSLSSGYGVKTVYFRVKNAAGESIPATDSITLNEPGPGTQETVLLPGSVPLALVYVPGGSFAMGRNPGEQDSKPEEDLQHPVTVPALWMGKYEITKRQWKAVMNTEPWAGRDFVLNDPDSPAVWVSWIDAQEFITAVNAYTGWTLRLPSEAEWEYACRAGTTTRFYWGDDPTYSEGDAYCWWTYNAESINQKYAHVVGQKFANAWGLHDMSGNVWEWCQDWYHANYVGAPADGSAWTWPVGSRRMGRGGCWNCGGGVCRSACRSGGTVPTGISESLGFRVCRSGGPQTGQPAITSLRINNGATATSSCAVTLNNACTGSPTHFMASESAVFTGASWKPYTTAPLFMLSLPSGVKAVHFKVKNNVAASIPFTDTITRNEPAPGTEETVALPGEEPLVMVYMPGGTFWMGRYPGEQDSDSSEDPQHEVTVPGFWMAKYELTKAQWTAVTGTTPWSGQSYVLNDPDTPAVYVSWDAAKTFITELSDSTGMRFQLPSEALWEYACRAGTATRFYWGDDPAYAETGDYAWYTDNVSSVGELYAHIVGRKEPNAFGLYDMSGNVFEWVEDDYLGDYDGAPSDARAWVATPRASYRRFRGGSWDNANHTCRSAFRTFNVVPSGATGSIGLRVSLLDEPPGGTEETVLLPGNVPLVMVHITGGTFLMGRNTGEQSSSADEDPQHEVTLPSFWMAKNEVTKRQWKAVMNTEPWAGQPDVLSDLDSPAVYVSWDGAKSFISFLNAYTGKTFRLPTEAEWEYACRAGTSTRFYWGDDLDHTLGDPYCWWMYNTWDAAERYAHVVGRKLPNTWGLYDMSGNVAEWCEDDMHLDYTGAPGDGRAWVDSPRSTHRIMRGGYWSIVESVCRSASRGWIDKSETLSVIGFRLAR